MEKQKQNFKHRKYGGKKSLTGGNNYLYSPRQGRFAVNYTFEKAKLIGNSTGRKVFTLTLLK